MNGDFALSQGREEGFLLILSSPEVGGVLCQEELLFTPTCRHGTFEAFVKRGIWQRATRVLSFTNSSLWDDNARSRLHLPLRGKRDEIPLYEEGVAGSCCTQENMNDVFLFFCDQSSSSDLIL